MTTRSAEYLIFVIAMVLTGVIAMDRHWRMDAALQRVDTVESLLIECQGELAVVNGTNG